MLRHGVMLSELLMCCVCSESDIFCSLGCARNCITYQNEQWSYTIYGNSMLRTLMGTPISFFTRHFNIILRTNSSSVYCQCIFPPISKEHIHYLFLLYTEESPSSDRYRHGLLMSSNLASALWPQFSCCSFSGEGTHPYVCHLSLRCSMKEMFPLPFENTSLHVRAFSLIYLISPVHNILVLTLPNIYETNYINWVLLDLSSHDTLPAFTILF